MKPIGKKGVIGQALTTFPVLFYVFLIMLIFIIISYFAVKFADGGRDDSSFVESSLFVESQVPVEVFLNDFVVINGEKKQIVHVIGEMVETDEKNARELAGLVQKKFDYDYSCEGENKLFVERGVVGGGVKAANQAGILATAKRRIFINYPEKEKVEFETRDLDRNFLPGTKQNNEQKKIIEPPFDGGYTKEMKSPKLKGDFAVSVKKDRDCELSYPLFDYEESERLEGAGNEE